jgi:acetylornithine deacetylase/succinyl-diaminopimelate desuccinylase-like protein
MSDSLMEAVSAHREAMIALTSELVAIPSENPPGNSYAESIQLLSRWLRELGFNDTRVEGDCVLSSRRRRRADAVFQRSLRCGARAEPVAV